MIRDPDQYSIVLCSHGNHHPGISFCDLFGCENLVRSRIPYCCGCSIFHPGLPCFTACLTSSSGGVVLTQLVSSLGIICCFLSPDSKVHGANIGPTWVLSAPDGPHAGPMNLAIRVLIEQKHDLLQGAVRYCNFIKINPSIVLPRLSLTASGGLQSKWKFVLCKAVWLSWYEKLSNIWKSLK